MKEADMVRIAEFIDRAIKARGDSAALKRLLMGVIEFSNQFGVPGIA
jgi:hypothetical protein